MSKKIKKLGGKEKSPKRPLKMVPPKEPKNIPIEEIDIIQKGKDKGLTYNQIREKVNHWRVSQDRPESKGKKGMYNLISRVVSDKGGMVNKAIEKWETYKERAKQYKSLIASVKKIKNPRKRAFRARAASILWNRPKGRQTELVATYDAETDDTVLCTPPC